MTPPQPATAPCTSTSNLATTSDSTAAVVDFDSGSVVEKSSYLAYGAVDADYRSGGFREPYRYTGHHDDSEVGLTYFGARYYIPTLARWASPDPLTIHGLGSSLNPYSFVHGSPLGDINPFGLYGEDDGVQPSGADGSGLTFQIDWFGGGGSGGGSGSTFAGGRTPPPAQAPFTFQQWNLATAGTFQTPQPGASPSWALASALRTHNGEGWKALANIGIDLLADDAKSISWPYSYFADVGSLIPRLRIDPHDDAAVAYDAMHFVVTAAAMIASDGLEGAGTAIEGTIEKAVANVAEGTIPAESQLARAWNAADNLSATNEVVEHVLERHSFGRRRPVLESSQKAPTYRISSRTRWPTGPSDPATPATRTPSSSSMSSQVQLA